MRHEPVLHNESARRREPPPGVRVCDMVLSLAVIVTVVAMSVDRYQIPASDYVAALRLATPRTGVLADVGLNVVDASGRVAVEDGPASLVDLARGRCTYVVIGSVDCPFSMALAQRWQTIAGHEGRQATFPGAWQGLWVWVGATDQPVTFLGPDFPVPRFQAESAVAFIKTLGVNAFPYHLVLDPEGMVVTHGLGGPLLPLAAFLEDCQLEPQRPTQMAPVTAGPVVSGK